MPALQKELFTQNGDLPVAVGTALAVLAAFFLLSLILRRRLMPAVIRRLDEDRFPIWLHLARGFQRPLALLLKMAGICIALISLCRRETAAGFPLFWRQTAQALLPCLYTGLRISVVVCLTWGLVSSSNITYLLLRRARNKLDFQMGKSVARFFAAVFNVVVLAVAAVVIFGEMGIDLNGLLAGLGLGGLTIALAAQNSAANFFGGLVLVTEKPFEIGDYIECKGVDGTVEDINLRSTKIRTKTGSLTVVPNSTLAAEPITNWSSVMEKRRADFTLALTHDTAQGRLRQFCDAVQTMLETDPDILADSVSVRFSDFGASSLDVRVMFFTSLPGFSDHMRIKERVNYAIMNLAKTYQVEFAFPTGTVILKNPAPQEKPPLPSAQGTAPADHAGAFP